jgi:hypothetical protein
MMILATISLQQISEIMKMAAVVVGGLWAAWTFQKLQKAQAAELGNRAKRTAIETSRVEQEEGRTRMLRQQPQLAIDIKVTETAASAAGYASLLGISVTVKNEGEQNLKIEFGPSPLTVGRIVFQKNGEQNLEIGRFAAPYFSEEKNEPEAFRERLLRAGQRRQMALAVLPVKEASAYMLQFRVRYVRFPFDGENQTKFDEGLTIDAVEQAIYFAMGKAAGSGRAAS